MPTAANRRRRPASWHRGLQPGPDSPLGGFRRAPFNGQRGRRAERSA